MLLITLQYFPFNLNVSFLQLKDQLTEKHYLISFFIHVYSSFIVLIIGFLQFLNFIRFRFPKVHKILGYIYIVLVLTLSSPSGFIMGVYGNGGVFSQISFCLQSLLWFVFTFYAYKMAVMKNYSMHLNLMMYSYAMTLSAISLRLFKWIIVNAMELPPMDTYKIVVWLGWIFNLLVVFTIINVRKRKLFQSLN